MGLGFERNDAFYFLGAEIVWLGVVARGEELYEGTAAEGYVVFVS